MPTKVKSPEEVVKEKQAAQLRRLDARLLRSEIKDVANSANVVRNTVVSYLSGNVAKTDKAEKILSAGRKIIQNRNRNVNKKVA